MVLLFVIAGVVLVFTLMGGSLTQLLSSSREENVLVQIKESNTWVVEGSDDLPRTIHDCPYQKGDNISISYKQGLPSLEGHRAS
jgi:hypothetical protein